jgi:mannose-1-phosphate guanylyltransferase
MADTQESQSAPALAEIDVVVLAGGLGTRIRHVLGDVPKVLAPINGRPFLEYLLDRLAALGSRRVLLALGHLAGQVSEYLARHPRDDIEILTIVEPEPLGTGGALSHVRSSLRSDPVLVMNGDTHVDADLAWFAASHHAAGAEASILCVDVDSGDRYGRIEVAADGNVRRFIEKDPNYSGPATISAGIYLFSAALLDRLAASEGASLERDFLERLPAGSIHAAIARDSSFIDIGTPDSLIRAADVLDAAVSPRTGGAPA